MKVTFCVVVNEFYSNRVNSSLLTTVVVNSEELIGTTEYLTH